MNDIILSGHGGCGNHGCEALVRSTNLIAKKYTPSFNLFLTTTKSEEDKKYLGADYSIEGLSCRKRNMDFWVSFLKMKLTGDYAQFDIYPYREIIRKHSKLKGLLSIGGDNYCYGHTEVFASLNKLFNSKGIPTVLWGCSIEPDSLNKVVIDDLRRYTLITARESITFDALRNIGLSNVSLYPDPAFVLPFETHESAPFDETMEWVGINASPYISRFEHTKDLLKVNYCNLIQYILDNHKFNIALIPHVVWPHSDDRKPLLELYEMFRNTGRVVLIEDYNAMELKGIISKCHFMVAARTHASIAAYSTGVPTLVVGYSVKSKGIARDIFGSEENYVVPVQRLTGPYCLTDSFIWLAEHEMQIRSHLQAIIPQYVERAWKAGEVLRSLL